MSTKLVKQINVLILDGETSFSLSVIDCLSDFKEINIHLIFSSKTNVEAKYSKHISSYTFYNTTGVETDFIKFLKNEIQKKKINVLLPIHFWATKLVSKYKRVFESLNIKILASSIESLDIANNKLELSKFLKTHSIPGPITIGTNIITKNLVYPLLYKPLDEAGGNGIKLIKNKEEWDVHSKIIQNEKFILQQYIKGYDIDCSILSLKGQILSFTIQKAYIPSSKLYSPALGVEFLYNDKVYKIVKKLIKSLNWTGVAHIDLRYDQIKKKFKVIEINPRYWGSVEASNKVGVNFPYLYCLTAMGKQFESPTYSFEKCVNNRGMIKVIKSILSLNKRKIEFPEHLTIKRDILNPLPKLVRYLMTILRKVKLLT